MTNINGKWIRREHFDTEEDRKKAMRDWHRRYYEIFRSDDQFCNCLLYTSPSPRDATLSRMPSSA